MIAQQLEIKMNEQKRVVAVYEGVVTPHHLELQFSERSLK